MVAVKRMFCTLDVDIYTLCNTCMYVCVLVVEECKRRLLAVGFKELREKESWNVNPLGKV